MKRLLSIAGPLFCVITTIVTIAVAIKAAHSRREEAGALARSLQPTPGVSAITELALENGYSNVFYVVVFEREGQKFCSEVHSNRVGAVHPVDIKNVGALRRGAPL